MTRFASCFTGHLTQPSAELIMGSPILYCTGTGSSSKPVLHPAQCRRQLELTSGKAPASPMGLLSKTTGTNLDRLDWAHLVLHRSIPHTLPRLAHPWTHPFSTLPPPPTLPKPLCWPSSTIAGTAYLCEPQHPWACVTPLTGSVPSTLAQTCLTARLQQHWADASNLPQPKGASRSRPRSHSSAPLHSSICFHPPPHHFLTTEKCVYLSR